MRTSFWHSLNSASESIFWEFIGHRLEGIVHLKRLTLVIFATVTLPAQSASPTITTIPQQTIQQAASTAAIQFLVNDSDTPADELIVSASSANDVLVPNNGSAMVLAGSGSNRTIQVVPDPNYSGSTDITVVVNDGTDQARTTFGVVVAPTFSSEQLMFTATEDLSPQQIRFWFQDKGTGATNYTLEYLPEITPGLEWSNAVGVVFSPLGNGVFQAELSPPPTDTGFYRLRGLRALVAAFESGGISVNEGAGPVNPVIVFNGPYVGTVQYSMSGTAGTGDYVALSGEVDVNGNTAVIPLTLLDNAAINQLRYLTLTLQSGTGFLVGGQSQATVTINENDAVWQGILETDTGTLGFDLKMIEEGDTTLGEFTGGAFGFFPSNGLPAQITLSETRFTGNIVNIPIPVEATLLQVPINLSLQLFADEALVGGVIHAVTEDRIEGTATLVIDVPDIPHLAVTNRGTFVMHKPPVAASTNEVELVNTP